MRARSDRDVFPIAPHTITPGDGQNRDSSEKMTFRHLCARFVVNHSIEDAPAIDAESRVAAALVSEQRVHADANVV
ncbi:hypothetical protein TNCV_1468691 [Trichonephila clavipes]|uniref:Uncharacterized protein n=1 Tax=Trichonephila clavipes TaxID=2585209 RepID=A0A8X6V289_TRICX|nr:hypothetical protein TNCV_1468691 [Trichonephila clavipes]